ncbi:MAG: hypothetical protein HYV09_06235 [Deltaproteobacteria bacterium]|nr:hypothetical protein [Deltaproteobacteria bacterium]
MEVGDVREAIASIAGVATLARAQGVGPKALRDLLPGLRSTCLAVPAIVAAALVQACDVVALATGLEVDSRSALEALVAAARRSASEVLAAIEAAEQKGLGARTRLTLQAACDRTVEELARVRHAIELLQRASLGEPLPIALDDLLGELDGDELGGTPVELWLLGDLDQTVIVQPRIALAVMLGALAHVRALAGGTAFVAVTSATAERVSVTFRRRAADDPEGELIRVTVPDEVAYDQLVLRLAAATLAAPLVIDGRAVRLDLLRA